jgi:hypothetical protein
MATLYRHRTAGYFQLYVELFYVQLRVTIFRIVSLSACQCFSFSISKEVDALRPLEGHSGKRILFGMPRCSPRTESLSRQNIPAPLSTVIPSSQFAGIPGVVSVLQVTVAFL